MGTGRWVIPMTSPVGYSTLKFPAISFGTLAALSTVQL
jgi:hypothetical protein